MEHNGNEDFNNDLYVDQSLPSDDYMKCDIFREQEIFPRIGQDYQVNIPMLLKKSDNLSNTRSPTESHVKNHTKSTNFKLTSYEIHHSKVNGAVASEESTELGFSFHSWSDAEKESFLLGLYIFSRNFVQLKRFLESIKMEDILSYYYGSFYRSHEYCQWSECRKMRRKGVVGQKIFTGLRQQEFMSRILSSMSEEVKNAVLEVCTMFGEEKMTLDEFIFSMKNLVGIKALVEVVGIGKGKKDLTMALEPSRTNQIMPTGKECASLTLSDIVKYLSGNYRLSKARSNDLFWEAVWPRLLARGWHSEEPKDQFYGAVSGRKKRLVFLVPGIVKFSRRNLTNGNHYFDSVTDVLKKVALDPGLIELENDDNTSKRNQEHEMISEEDNVKRHCYLQPRTSICATDAMKFTVIDTGLDDGKSYKVRELRSLSLGFLYKVDSMRCIEISDDNMFDVDTSVLNNAYNTDSEDSVILSNREVLSDMKILDNNDPMMQVPDPEGISASKIIHTCQEDENRDVKDDTENNVLVAKKRRRLTSCDHLAQTGSFMTSTSHDLVKRWQEIPSRVIMSISGAPDDLKHHDVFETSTFVSSHDELSLSSSSKSSLGSQEGIQIQNTIDLNLPATDCEKSFSVTQFNGDHDEINKGTTFTEQQLNVNPQRRGTRTRAPTTRALEAVAFGLNSVNTKWKGKYGKFN